MALPVSPIRKITRLDRTQDQHLYRAADIQQHPLRYLHFSGESLTTDKTYSWIGTRRQFLALCEKHEWDALTLVPNGRR